MKMNRKIETKEYKKQIRKLNPIKKFITFFIHDEQYKDIQMAIEINKTIIDLIIRFELLFEHRIISHISVKHKHLHPVRLLTNGNLIIE